MAKFFVIVILFLCVFNNGQKYVDGATTGFKQELRARVPRQFDFKSLFERLTLPPSPQKKELKLLCHECDDFDEVPKESARSSDEENLKLRRHLIYDYLRMMLERVQTILKAFAEYRAKISTIANNSD